VSVLLLAKSKQQIAAMYWVIGDVYMLVQQTAKESLTKARLKRELQALTAAHKKNTHPKMRI